MDLQYTIISRTGGSITKVMIGALLCVGLVLKSYGEEIVNSSFEGKDSAGWEVKATEGTEPPRLEVLEAKGDQAASSYVLRVDDSEYAGTDGAFDLSYQMPEEISGTIEISFKIRFLKEGVGSHLNADVRVSVREVADLTYVRFRTAPGRLSGVSYHDKERSEHIQSELSELRPEAWYLVTLRLDLDHGDYSWQVDNLENSDPTQHAGAKDIPLYNSSKVIKKFSLVSVLRGGVFEIDDLKVETGR